MITIVGPGVDLKADNVADALRAVEKIVLPFKEVVVDVAMYEKSPLQMFMANERALRAGERLRFTGARSEWLFLPGVYSLELLRFVERFEGKVCVCTTETVDQSELLDTHWLVCQGPHSTEGGLFPFVQDAALQVCGYFMGGFLPTTTSTTAASTARMMIMTSKTLQPRPPALEGTAGAGAEHW